MSVPFLLALLAACQAPVPTDSGHFDLPDATGTGDTVRIETIYGAIDVKLFLAEAPVTTGNFLSYVEAGYYDGTDGDGAGTFYRAAPDFVLQGGSRRLDGSEKPTQDAIANEAIASGLSNTLGTVAMARKPEPDTARAEFFINVDDNLFLDPGENTEAGYAVFGEVVSGWDVVELVMAQPVTPNDSLKTPVEFLVVTRI